jgi:hypothetical protein
LAGTFSASVEYIRKTAVEKGADIFFNWRRRGNRREVAATAKETVASPRETGKDRADIATLSTPETPC